MKTIRVHQFGDPSVMKIEEVPDPAAAAGQVVVTIKAAGVNPVDTYIRSGQYAALPPLPYTPGADGAGIVETVGSGVHEFAPGDRVYIAGTVTDGRTARTPRKRPALSIRCITCRREFHFSRAPA